MNTAYGSIDLQFTSELSEGLLVEIQTGISGYRSFEFLTEDSVSQAVSVFIAVEVGGEPPYDEGVLFTCYTKIGDEIVDRADYISDLQPNAPLTNFRLYIADERISVYANGKWIYTYFLQQVIFEEDDPPMKMIVTGGSLTVTNIKRIELCDSREALFIDYEAKSDNAISSVIQERPVEVYPSINRAAQFTYSTTKSEVPGIKISSWREDDGRSRDVSSDGIVYGRDVSISLDEEVAEKYGLITRLFRMPDLNSGVIRAVRALQKKARESTVMVTANGRFDPRLETGDVLTINKNVTGTQTNISRKMIVENYTISISDGKSTQVSSGRKES